MWMPEPHSPFHSLSHTSIGTSPNTFKKGKKNTSLPRWSVPRSLQRQVCRSAALAQCCALDWQAMEERGQAAGLFPGSCPPSACMLPDLPTCHEIQRPGMMVGSPLSRPKQWFLLKVQSILLQQKHHPLPSLLEHSSAPLSAFTCEESESRGGVRG